MSNLWVDHLDDFKRSHVSKLRRRCLQLSFHLMVSRWILDQVTYHAARVWASHSIDASQLKSQHCRSCGSHGGLGWQMLSSFKWFWTTILGTTNVGKSLFGAESSNIMNGKCGPYWSCYIAAIPHVKNTNKLHLPSLASNQKQKSFT